MGVVKKSKFLFIPTSYKEGNMLSVIPSSNNNLLNFSRTSASWRINENMELEPVPFNKLGNSDRAELALRFVTLTYSATTSPTGLPDATLMVENAASFYTYGSYTYYSSTDYLTQENISCYVKDYSNDRDFIIYVYHKDRYVRFNVQNGTVVTNTEPSRFTPKIENVGNGWYRCSVAMNWLGTSPSTNMVLQLSSSFNRDGNGTSGLYVWGMQRTSGLNLKPYFSRTNGLNVPTVDYSDGEPTVLIEDAKTNYLTRSEDFNTIIWQSGVTINANVTMAPNFTPYASEIVFKETNGFLKWDFNIPASKYTFSMFIKKSVDNIISFRNEYHLSGSNNHTLTFDFENETMTGGTFTKLSNGWYRIEGTITTTVTRNQLRLIPLNCRFYAFGAQLELGTFASTYIRTLGSQVTRSSDNKVDIIPTPQTSGFLGDVGSVYIRGFLKGNTQHYNYVFSSSGYNGVSFNYSTDGTLLRMRTYDNGAFIGDLSLDSNYYNGKEFRIVFKYDGQKCYFFYNGVYKGNLTFTGKINQIFSSASVYQGPSTLGIKDLILFNTFISDADAISLTR